MKKIYKRCLYTYLDPEIEKVETRTTNRLATVRFKTDKANYEKRRDELKNTDCPSISQLID